MPLIKSAIEQLGFKYGDTKVLLISHAHADHDGGSAQIIKDTGARYMVMDGDAPVVESGGKSDFIYSKMTYPAALFRFETACLRMNSICALTLRRSSAAHFSISFHNSGGTRSRNGLRCSAPTSGVEGAGVDHGSGFRVSAQHHQ